MDRRKQSFGRPVCFNHIFTFKLPTTPLVPYFSNYYMAKCDLTDFPVLVLLLHFHNNVWNRR